MTHVHRIRCDNCDTEVDFEAFGDWWRLGVHAPGHIIKTESMDFCTQKCLREWLVTAAWTGADQ